PAAPELPNPRRNSSARLNAASCILSGTSLAISAACLKRSFRLVSAIAAVLQSRSQLVQGKKSRGRVHFLRTVQVSNRILPLLFTLRIENKSVPFLSFL